MKTLQARAAAILLLSFLTLTPVSAQETRQSASPKANVHLWGQLKGMGTRKVTMAYDGASALVGDSRDITINTDAQGNFDTMIYVPKPTYYMIYRNTLYLSPGDDLQCHITPSNDEATFSGKGAEANQYLKNRAFPHAGCYLVGGQYLKADYPSTLAFIDSVAKARTAELTHLKTASPDFIDQEKARIAGEQVNSIFYYPVYALIYAKTRHAEMTAKTIDSFFVAHKDDADGLIRQMAKDKYLDVSVVRSVLLQIMSDSVTYRAFSHDFAPTTRMNDLLKAVVASLNLKRDASEATLLQANMTAEGLKEEDFASELKEKIAQARKLEAGQEAFDFVMTDRQGKTHRLSEYKGKFIYIDFWATWCGPCIQESPAFEKLCKQYAGKDIVFLQVSIDKNEGAWKRYIATKNKVALQYRSVDPVLKEKWAVLFIPRFVLVDDQFRIVNPFAPRPSEKAIESLLDARLSAR